MAKHRIDDPASRGPNCPSLQWRFCVRRADYVVVVDVQKQLASIDSTRVRRGTVWPLLYGDPNMLKERVHEDSTLSPRVIIHQDEIVTKMFTIWSQYWLNNLVPEQ